MLKFGYRISVLILSVFLAGCFAAPETLTQNIDWSGEHKGVNALLDEFTDSHQDAGCDMQLLIDGENSAKLFTDLIETAKHYIHIETLNFDNDAEAGQDLSMEYAQMIADKAISGVEVKILLDPLANAFMSRPEIVRTLKQAGVSVIEYQKTYDKPYQIPFLASFSHKKLLVVDGEQAIVGGMNFGVRYLGDNRWRDTNAMLTGPIVESIEREFIHDWKYNGGDIENPDSYLPKQPTTGDLNIRSIDQRPAEDDFDINTAVSIAINSAEQKIDIEAPYFNPIDWLMDDLRDAVGRGVTVRILTNSKSSYDVPIGYPATAYWFEQLVEDGIGIFVWDSSTQHTMHSKAMVVDDNFAMLGSYNFNNRSIIWDTESAIILTQPEGVAPIAKMIDDDFNNEIVHEIDQNWIDSQSDQERERWNIIHAIHWLF